MPFLDTRIKYARKIFWSNEVYTVSKTASTMLISNRVSHSRISSLRKTSNSIYNLWLTYIKLYIMYWPDIQIHSTTDTETAEVDSRGVISGIIFQLLFRVSNFSFLSSSWSCDWYWWISLITCTVLVCMHSCNVAVVLHHPAR